MVQSFQSEMNNNSESNLFSNDSNNIPNGTNAINVSNNDTNSKSMTENGRFPQIPFEELKAKILAQLEFYLSQKNLASDAFLLGKMDSDYFVDVEILANFNMMRRLTNDCNLVKEVLKESTQLELSSDGNKVRPRRLKYGIVILREIRDDTPVEEIEKLFDNKNCPKVLSCEFVHNASWYIMFESKEEANQAHRYLREQVKEFQGRPIMARVKSKSSIHSKINGYRNNIQPLATQSLMMPFLTPTTIVSSYNNNVNLIGATTASLTVTTNSPGVPTFTNLPTVNSSVQQVPTPIFDPVQQRLVYSNNSNHGNASVPLHYYNYYTPPSIVQWSGPGQPSYVDFGSMFAYNGLSPHTSYSPNNSGQTSVSFVNSSNTSIPSSTINTNSVNSLRSSTMLSTAHSGVISGGNNFGNGFNQRGGGGNGKGSRNFGQVTMFPANSYQRTNSLHCPDNNSGSSLGIRRRRNHDDSNNSMAYGNNGQFGYYYNSNNNQNSTYSNFGNSGNNRPVTAQHYYSNNNYSGHFKSQAVKEKDSTFDLERAKFPPLRLSSDHGKNVVNDDIQSTNNYDTNCSSFTTKDGLSDNVMAGVSTNVNKIKAKDITAGVIMNDSDISTGIQSEKDGNDNGKSSSISVTDSFPTSISPSLVTNMITNSVEALSLSNSTNKEHVVCKKMDDCVVNHSSQVIDTKDAATLTNCDNESDKVMYVSRLKNTVSEIPKTDDDLSEKPILERNELKGSKLMLFASNTKNASTMTVNHAPPSTNLATVTNLPPLAVNNHDNNNNNNNCGGTAMTMVTDVKNKVVKSLSTAVSNGAGCKLPPQLTYVPTVSLNDANNNVQMDSNNVEPQVVTRSKSSKKMSYAQVTQNNLTSKEESNDNKVPTLVNQANNFGQGCIGNGNQNDFSADNSIRGSRENNLNTASSNGSLDSAAHYQQNSAKRSYQKGYKSNNRNYKQSKGYSSNNKNNNSTANRGNNRQSKKHSS